MARKDPGAIRPLIDGYPAFVAAGAPDPIFDDEIVGLRIDPNADALVLLRTLER
jgi:hypothetical protein